MMQLRLQFQQNPVADEVSALIAVVRPILEGLLFGLKTEAAGFVGGLDKVTLASMARLYRPGDRDCGICFEYAVHDALNRGEATVLERLDDAMKFCKIRGSRPESILFGLEKSGALNLIDTAKERLTEESRLLAGYRGQPAKLKRHIDSIAAAFRKKEARDALPWSISGLWKADLFVGRTDVDRWIATSVKINPSTLEGARGLRIGIVPARDGRGDAIHMNEALNLVVCPLPHDQSFMEIFYQGFHLVKLFLAADAHLPKQDILPRAADRQVARELETRRDVTVLDVLDVLAKLAQPELFRTEEHNPQLVSRRESNPEIETGAVVAPMPRSTE